MKSVPVLTRILQDEADRQVSEYEKDIIWLRIASTLGFPKEAVLSGISDDKTREALRCLIA